MHSSLSALARNKGKVQENHEFIFFPALSNEVFRSLNYFMLTSPVSRLSGRSTSNFQKWTFVLLERGKYKMAQNLYSKTSRDIQIKRGTIICEININMALKWKFFKMD
jgi:hypothetical protein